MLDRIHLWGGLGLVSAGESSGVVGKAECLDSRSKSEQGGAEDRNMEVAQQRVSGRVPAGVSDEAKGDGANGHSHAHR